MILSVGTLLKMEIVYSSVKLLILFWKSLKKCITLVVGTQLQQILIIKRYVTALLVAWFTSTLQCHTVITIVSLRASYHI